MHYKIIFLGVDYNSHEETLGWLNSITQIEGENLALIVDNSDTFCENFEKEIKKVSMEVVYVFSNDNLGYFGGARQGLDYIGKEGITYDYLVVCNVDIRISSPNMLSVLEEYSNEKNIGLISPAFIGEGHDYNPYKLKRLTLQQMERRRLYYQYPYFQKLIDILRRVKAKLSRKNSIKYNIGTRIYMTYGACFIFHKNYFIKGADLELPLFLFGEEQYVSEQCREKQLEIIYDPRIVVYNNNAHVSTGRLISKMKNQYLLDETLYGINTYYKK